LLMDESGAGTCAKQVDTTPVIYLKEKALTELNVIPCDDTGVLVLIRELEELPPDNCCVVCGKAGPIYPKVSRKVRYGTQTHCFRCWHGGEPFAVVNAGGSSG
jgi:hypothetical protein